MKQSRSRTSKRKTTKHWEEKQYEGKPIGRSKVFVKDEICPACNGTQYDENGDPCTICIRGDFRQKFFYIAIGLAAAVFALLQLPGAAGKDRRF